MDLSPGFRYRIYKSTSLLSEGEGQWSHVGIVDSSSFTSSWVDLQPTTKQAFYRISHPLDAEAVSYRAETGISFSRAIAVSKFFKGLNELGLRSSFLDGSCYRADTQAEGSTYHSLRLLSNATAVSGTPIRDRYAIFLGTPGVLPTKLAMTVPSHSGARTFIPIHAGEAYATSTWVGELTCYPHTQDLNFSDIFHKTKRSSP